MLYVIVTPQVRSTTDVGKGV